MKPGNWLGYFIFTYALVSPVSLSATNIVLGLIFSLGLLLVYLRHAEWAALDIKLLSLMVLYFFWSAVTRVISGAPLDIVAFSNVWEYTPIVLLPFLLAVSKVRKNRVVFALLISSSLVCLLGILQYLIPAVVYPFPRQLVRGDFRGFFAHHLHTGGFYSITTVLSFSIAIFWEEAGEKRPYLWVFFLLNLAALLLSMTRSYYLSVTFTLLLLLLVKNWRWFMSGSIGFAILLITILSFPNPVNSRVQTLFDSEHGSNKGRIYIWKAAIEMIKEYPLAGVGGGNWKKMAISTYYPRFEKEWQFGPANYPHAHNVYLTRAAETGLIGLFLFLVFWLTVTWTLCSKLPGAGKGTFDHALIVGTLGGLGNLFVAGMFENNFGTAVIVLLISFLIGLSLDPRLTKDLPDGLVNKNAY